MPRKPKWREEMRTALKANRTAHSKGKGDMYWNSVIAVAERFAKKMKEPPPPPKLKPLWERWFPDLFD